MNSIEKLISTFPEEMKSIGPKKYKIIAITSKYDFIVLDLDNLIYIENLDENDSDDDEYLLISGISIIDKKIIDLTYNKIISIIQINNILCKQEIYTRELNKYIYNLYFENLNINDFMEYPFNDTIKLIEKHNKNYKMYLNKIDEPIISIIKIKNNINVLEKELKFISKKLKNKSEIFKKIKPDNPILEEKCAICLNHFYEISNISDNIISLSCGHLFCNDCLYDLNKRVCPLCEMKFYSYSKSIFIKNMLEKSTYVIGKKNIELIKTKMKEIENKIKENMIIIDSFKLNKDKLIERRDKLKLELEIISENITEMDKVNL